MNVMQAKLVNFNGTSDKSASARDKRSEAGSESADAKTVKVVQYKKDRNPDRLANSMGVVAGTSGMVGGSIVGGLVGLLKFPFKTVKTALTQDYGSVVTDSMNAFKDKFVAFSSVDDLKKGITGLADELKSTNSADAAEEIINIVHTLSDRLNYAFKDDKAAKSVIDKVVDPIVASVSPRHNKKTTIGGLMKAAFSKGKNPNANPKSLAIMKWLGFPIKTSTIAANVTSNFVKGFGEAVANIQSFTAEEKQAWSKVAEQITTEFEKNPKIFKSKNLISHFKNVLNGVKDVANTKDLLKEPLKGMQEVLSKGIDEAGKKITMSPVKTIGKYAIIGALAGGVIAVLSWLGLKTTLMSKNKD